MKKHVASMLGMAVGIVFAASTNGAAVTCEVPSGPFTTIQSALDNVLCGKIIVKPGTYTEQLVVARSVTLSGDKKTPSIIQAPAALAEPRAIIHVTGSGTDAILENLTIRGPGGSGCDSLRYGIRVDGDAKATIRKNKLTAIRDEPLGGCQNGNAIQVGRNFEGTFGSAIITNNEIDDYQKTGIVVDGVNSTAAISTNTITGSGPRTSPLAAQNGIQISRGAVGTVKTNEVLNNSYDPTIAGSGGLLLFEAGSGVVLEKNTTTGNDVGIWVIATNGAMLEANKSTNSVFDGIALDNENFTPGVTTDFNILRRNRLFDNGVGIGLYSANTNVIDRNRVRGGLSNLSGGTGDGFVVFFQADFQSVGDQPYSSGNVFQNNLTLKNEGIGYVDGSTGSGTGGTANTYINNRCNKDVGGGSDPAGLCKGSSNSSPLSVPSSPPAASPF
jgi:parallel beta-helix repeat protein